MKKRLTQHEEFEILKLVLDKFLWLGFGIMAIGFYVMATQGMDAIWTALGFTITGIVVLALFIYLLVREYEVLR
ncbi:MAG: hypothetical protein ACMXYC_01350 [Candidatus Woesearchaeota archaeon]